MKQVSLKEPIIKLIYGLSFNVTKDSRLAIFQKKIIYHILPHRFDTLDLAIQSCHFCGERQTLTQLFDPCSEAQRFLVSVY